MLKIELSPDAMHALAILANKEDLSLEQTAEKLLTRVLVELGKDPERDKKFNELVEKLFRERRSAFEALAKGPE